MLLALDTSGPFCSALILDNDKIVANRSDDLGRGHAEHLMPMLEEMLLDTGIGWGLFSKIACTTGPGSFTGLRVGLATARGLALALGCPCQGVTVFEAFAHGESQPLAIVLDARREQIWMQIFAAQSKPMGKPSAFSLEHALDNLPVSVSRLAGSAASLLASNRTDLSILTDAASPPIEGVARAAMLLTFDDTRPKPLYLRAPDAKPQSPPLLAP